MKSEIIMKKVTALLSNIDYPRIAICFLFALAIAMISASPKVMDISSHTVIETISHFAVCFTVPFIVQWFITKEIFG